MANEKNNANNKTGKTVTVKFGRQVPIPSNSLKPSTPKPTTKKQLLLILDFRFDDIKIMEKS